MFVSASSQEFPVFYGTRRTIIIFTAAGHWAPILSHINPAYIVTTDFKIYLGKERYELELNRFGINRNSELQMLSDNT
jgi:hypothetical protein